MTKSLPFTRRVPLLHSLHGLPIKFRSSRSVCWPSKLCEKRPVYLHSMLAPSRSHRSNKGITLSVPRVKTNPGARAFHSSTPSLRNNLPLSVRSATSIATFRNVSKHISLTWPFYPIDTSMQDDPLMLQNCFIDFAVEYRFGCHITEPGYTRHIGTIETWLIDWCFPPSPLLPHDMRGFVALQRSRYVNAGGRGVT